MRAKLNEKPKGSKDSTRQKYVRAFDLSKIREGEAK